MRTILIVVVVALLLVTRSWWEQSPPPSPAAPLAPGMYEVVRVVDGDTIIFAPDNRVRLIGVDTPETVRPEHPVEPFGPEATAFTRAFLAGGRARLAFDRQRVDRFGRFLAYVWVGDQMLNEELLRAGFARWEPNFHYSGEIKRRFRAAQQEARDAQLGIWSQETARPAGIPQARTASQRKGSVRIGYIGASQIYWR